MKTIILSLFVILSFLSCKDENIKLTKFKVTLVKDIEDIDFQNYSKYHVELLETRTQKIYETYMDYKDVIVFNLPNGHYDLKVENIDCVEGLKFYYITHNITLSSDKVFEVIVKLEQCLE